MDLARCTLDNTVYNAVDFSKISDLATKRRHLVCEECKYPAYFKKASKSGQAACFGARPHKDGCSLATEDSDTAIGTLTETEKLLINDGCEVKVDFNFDTQTVIHTIESEDNGNRTGRVGNSHSSVNGIGVAVSRRKLSSLLNILINDTSFAKSNRKIDIGQKYPFNASTLFKKNEQLSKNDIEKFRGLYGQIVDVKLVTKKVPKDDGTKSEEKSLWLNFGGFDECSIVIPNLLLESFFNRFSEYEDDLDELSGKHVLCFGFIHQSQKDKFYIRLDDISKIVFK